MSKHLTVISYTQKMSTFLERVALTVRSREEHRVLRCQDPLDLKGLVRQAGGKGTLLLDLVGHCGDDQRFKLGDVPLVEAGTEPPAMFTGLGEVLQKEAQVRLLGCLTAPLIQVASAALNGRVVSGTTRYLWADEFDEDGLWREYGHLVSTGDPPPVQIDEAAQLEATEEDEEAARKWRQFLPAEYQVIRRGEPLVVAEASHSLGDAKITFAYARRLVLIEDAPQRPPLVLEWSGSASPPALQELLAALPPRS